MSHLTICHNHAQRAGGWTQLELSEGLCQMSATRTAGKQRAANSKQLASCQGALRWLHLNGRLPKGIGNRGSFLLHVYLVVRAPSHVRVHVAIHIAVVDSAALPERTTVSATICLGRHHHLRWARCVRHGRQSHRLGWAHGSFDNCFYGGFSSFG